MLPPTNESLQSLPGNILQTVGGNAVCLEACECLGHVKLNRHFLFLVPKAGLAELIIA